MCFGWGKDVDLTDTTAVANKLIHSLFSQCNVSLNSVAVTLSREHYIYRLFVETALTYGTDGATSHSTDTNFYPDLCEMQLCDPIIEKYSANTNEGFISRWSSLIGSSGVQIFGRLHTDRCNVPLNVLPSVRHYIKFKKPRPNIYLMNKTAVIKITVKFLVAYLLFSRVYHNTAISSAHSSALILRIEIPVYR